jgi:hypothetical protein
MTLWVLMALCISTNGDNRTTMTDASVFQSKARCERNAEYNKKEFETRCEQFSVECKPRDLNVGE